MNFEGDGQARCLRILQMIASMEPLKNTLEVLAGIAAALVTGGKAAVLVLKGQLLTVESARGFSERELDWMAGMSISRLTADSFRLPCSPVKFIVRTILSGAGEVLGAIVAGPAEAFPHRRDSESHLETIEGLAALAIEQSHLVEELNYRLEHDSLTDLYDRLSIERRISEALAFHQANKALSTPGGSGSRVALIAIGIDRFHRVNAALGHLVGNGLLRQAAQRLRQNCGPNAVLGRAGGDEFLVLIPHLTSNDEAAAMAERLLVLLRMPCRIGDHELSVTAAAGIGVSSQEDYRPEDLEARAYAALDHAKTLGGNQSAFFDSSMVTVSPEYLELESKLRGALDRNQLLLHFQPQVALDDYAMVGVEALLRWQHPDLGLVSPCSFIPIAEQGGLISDIGEWALGEGIRQMTAWKKEMVAWRKCEVGTLRMGVNVSPVQFRRQDFVRRILEIVDRACFDPGELLLEITEGAILTDLDHARPQMERLREAGIRFAIDDFGTGYSSLSYLQKLPVDHIKIDRSFVQEIVSPGQRHPVLENILRLASELGISATAEGIETQEQADALVAMGCQEGQGFLFSRPLPSEEMISWFQMEPGIAHPTCTI
jgi:diguanylate cyclase (GGDEF)-like protein